MALTTRSNIKSLLENGLKSIIDRTGDLPEETWQKIYTTKKSHKASESAVMMEGIGFGAVKREGQSVSFSDIREQYKNTAHNLTIAVATRVTKEAVDDDVYKTVTPNNFRVLKKALYNTRCKLAMNVFNNAFNANITYGDGQPLCATAHPVKGGEVFSNAAGGAGQGNIGTSLTKSALMDGIITIQAFKDPSGVPAYVNPKCLLVPESRTQFSASVMLKSNDYPFSTNNGSNPFKTDNYFPKGFLTDKYLTDPYKWFILTDVTDGFVHYERQKPETSVHIDHNTFDHICTASERYSFTVDDPRAVFGASS